MIKVNYMIFLFSIIIHELGHIFMSKILNVQFGKIKLGILGFSAKELDLTGIKKRSKILIFSSGAIFNLLGIFLILHTNLSSFLKEQIIYSNLLIAIFNLLPIVPLDGGNVLVCILEYKFNFRKSMRIALFISKIFLIFLSFLYCIMILIIKNIWLVVLFVYLWILYIREERRFELYIKIHKRYEELINLPKSLKL